LTSLSHGSPIGPPATAQFTEPLRQLSADATLVKNGIQLNWYTQSTLADRVEVRRSHREPSGNIVDDPSAAGTYPLSQTSRLDTDIIEATTYVYTFTLKAGQVSAPPTVARAGTYRLTDLVARVHAGNVELHWTNHIGTATEIQVVRGQGL